MAVTVSVVVYGQAKAPVVDNFADQGLVFERSETSYQMHGDGTGVRKVHVWIRVQSEGAARQFGVLSFAYASTNETPVIRLVRVHKPDGSSIDTPAADAMDMAAAVTREAPLYSDLKEKHLPVKSLSAGDTLEYQVDTSIDKAEAPGQFWGANHFTPPGTLIVLAEVLILEFPKDKYVQVWSPNHKPAITEHDGLKTYTWNVAQVVPAAKSDAGEDTAKAAGPKDPDLDDQGRSLPSVAWTTFHSWAEVGDWYRGLALSRTEPSDAIRAKAEELTKDAKTSEEKVRNLYNFVSTRTRYVGIDFGVGRYQPHAAAEVMANQYGDCKDKDTLLESLLRVQGYKTAPALIGMGITPVPELPSPAVFNHVITTVEMPEGKIWLDSTPEVAPYRFLSAPIRDQQALVVPAATSAMLERTPLRVPYPFEEHFEALAELDAEGKLTGKIAATYRSDDEVNVRALARAVAPAEWDKASQYVSSSLGFSGTTSKTNFKGLDNLNLPVEMTYDYNKHPFGDWDNRRIVPLFPVMPFTTLGSDAKEPDEDIELGAPRTLVAVSRIQLPEGYRTDLPDPIHVKTDFATVDKTYRFDGKEIVADRTIVVLKRKLPKTDWKHYDQFTKNILIDGETWIQLIKPLPKVESRPVALATNDSKLATPGTVPIPSKLLHGEEQAVTIQLAAPEATKAPLASLPDSATIPELMQRFQEQLRAMDSSGAMATLDKIKARNPEEQFLWAGYGSIAWMQHNWDEARADFQKELTKYPDNDGVALSLAAVEISSSDDAGARRSLQEFFDKHSDDVRIATMLAGLQAKAEDNLGALKTLQTASQQSPDDKSIRLGLSAALLRMDHKEEAAAAAKSVLDGAEDPGLLNDAAYALAQTGENLPMAEDASRKSIAKLEEQSAAITPAEGNSHAFAQSNQLIASWDTLGWIFFLEHKFEEARPWLIAAWRNSQGADDGDHVGQLYEAMGDKDSANNVYSLAQVTKEGGPPTPEVRRHIQQSLERLKNSGAKPGPKDGVDALQESRNYKLPKAEGVSGWGTFRLQIASSGIVGLQQMTGEKKLSALEDAIHAMTFPDLIPPDSKAHLLRSAVVSCSATTGCELVLVPNSSLVTEQY